VRLEDISAKGGQDDLSDVQINVRLFDNRVIFRVGLAGAEFGVANPGWGELDTITKLARAGLGAVNEAIEMDIGKQTITLVIHLRPMDCSISQVTARLLRSDTLGSIGEDASAYGLSVYRNDISWVVDRSAPFPEALFLRLSRDFEPDVSLEEVARRIHTDQGELLQLLQLEGE